MALKFEMSDQEYNRIKDRLFSELAIAKVERSYWMTESSDVISENSSAYAYSKTMVSFWEQVEKDLRLKFRNF